MSDIFALKTSKHARKFNEADVVLTQYFSRAFSKEMGILPSVVRKEMEG